MTLGESLAGMGFSLGTLLCLREKAIMFRLVTASRFLRHR
jgi:hypothetical protein